MLIRRRVGRQMERFEAENIAARFMLGNWRLRFRIMKIMEMEGRAKGKKMTRHDKAEMLLIACFVDVLEIFMGRDYVNKVVEAKLEEE